ncbi:MAG: signal peptidase I [Ruminococcaceae bacterium]|nr:signal peptidase I [Oscillospiraceae bacterium]
MKENKNAEPGTEETKKKSVGRELLEWVGCIAVALVITLLLQNYVFRIVKVDGSSMEPTLKNGERLVMLRLGYTPKAGDIVVVDVSDKQNLNRANGSRQLRYIKRIIGMPGDTVRFEERGGKVAVLINGEVREEPYIISDLYFNNVTLDKDYAVPADHVFVMGDNRPGSADSRLNSVGYIHTDNVLGEAVFRIWPLDKLGTP